MKIDFFSESKNIENELIEHRRHFHMYPELSSIEYNTSTYIKNFLKTEEIPFTEVSKTGICATISGKGKGRVVALRGDMDALPLDDKKNCTYSSKNSGVMHACGHDAHMTVLMGAAKLLNNHKDLINGTVKLFFEPAEETDGGAKTMIEEGVLLNPKVDGVIGLHVSSEVNTGYVELKEGVVNACSNPFKIKIIGKGGHGAYPHSTVDPVVCAAHIITALQSISSREVNPASPIVVTIGSIHGGTACNIIPEEVTLEGTARILDPNYREFVKKRIFEITNGICISMNAKCEVEIIDGYPNLINNPKLEGLFKNTVKNLIGEDKLIIRKNSSMGVESFAYFSLEVPSLFYNLGVRNESKGIINEAHGNYFDIDEAALSFGAALQCNLAIDFLNLDNSL